MNMQTRHIALRSASIFLGLWLLLALLVADFPPPPGFVFILLILFACALLVYLRVPVYAGWRKEGISGALVKVARDGFVAGMVIALLSLLSPGETGVRPGLADHLVWFGVLAVLGIGNALAVCFFATGAGRRQG